MTIVRLALAWCLCAVAVFGAPKEAARADWMNLTGAETAPNIAEITVLQDRVRIALEIYVGNLDTFEALLPDDWLKKPARLPLDARLQEFSSKTFQVIADGGVELRAVLNRAEPRMRKDRYSPFAGMVNPATRQRTPEPPEDKRVLYVELDYPFSGRPASLTFVPPLGAGGVPAVTMGFIAYHTSVPVIDFRYLSGPVTLKLDWSDPWYSKFDNPNLKRHHDSALMTFLYVEPREVRHEVLVRVRDLLQWIDLDLVDREKIDPGERADLKRRVGAFMRQRNPVSIDGAAATPASASVEFLKITTSGLQLTDDQERLDASSALLGVILSYPVAALPERVSMEWELFPSRIKRIPATSIDQAGPFVGFVETSDPLLIWQNHLLKYQDPKVRPVTRQIGVPAAVAMAALALSLLAVIAGVLVWRFARDSEFRRRLAVIAGGLAVGGAAVAVIAAGSVLFAGPPKAARAAEIVRAVLANVNHAFLEPTPAGLTKALNVVVAPASLADVEAELRRALTMQIPGGGLARIEAIEDLEIQELSALDRGTGFRSLAKWNAVASAGHWGHVHRRKLEFRALMELVREPDQWMLDGITVLAAKQQG